MHTYGAPMYDWLLWSAPGQGLVPGVLTKWDMAADAKSWTVAVRDDLTWHTGEKVTAADVKFTMENLTRPQATSTGIGTFKANIASVDVLSPTSARVNLKVAWPLMPWDFSLKAGPEGVVVPKAYTERVGEKEFELKPVGSGPWKMTRRDIAVRFVYEPSGIKHPYRETPKFKELEIILVPEETTRIAMLKTRAADIMEIGAFENGPELAKDRSLQVLRIDDVNIGIIVYGGILDARIKGKPLDKRDVRLAMELAVNKQEIVDTILGGFATVSPRTFVIPGTLGYTPDMKPRPYDPAQAKRLLAQAGYPNGFDITVYNNAAPGAAFLLRMTEAVAGYWTEIGVRPRVFQVERTIAAGYYRARPQADDWIGNAQPIYARITPTNLNFLRVFYHSKGTTLIYPSPEIDSLIDRAFSALDPKEQERLIAQVQNTAWEAAPDIAIAIVPNLYGVGPKVAGWKSIPTVGVGVLLETATPR